MDSVNNSDFKPTSIRPGDYYSTLNVPNIENNPPQRETTHVILDEIQQQRDKNFFVRNFSPISEGGVRSSVLTLFSGTIGATILALPFVMSYYGVVLGGILIILFSQVTNTSYTILNDLIEQSGKKSYANLCAFYFGENKGRIITQFLIFAQFCSSILYPSIIWNFAANLLNEYDIVKIPYINADQKIIDNNSAVAWKWRIIILGTLGAFIFPFNLQKRLATLRYFSMMILIAMVFTVVLSLAQAPTYYEHFKSDPKYEIYWLYAPFRIEWLQGMSTMMLAYNCIITFFFVRGEMRHKTTKRVKKVIRNVIRIETLLYLVMSIAGYWSLGNKLIPHLYTLRRKLTPDSSDTWMTVCQIFFCFAIALHIPITLFPSREQIYIYYKINSKGKTHFFLTLGMTFITIAIPTIYPDIIGLLGLVGGITVGTSGYIIPFLLKVQSLSDFKWYSWKKLKYVFLMWMAIVLGLGSCYCSIFRKGAQEG